MSLKVLWDEADRAETTAEGLKWEVAKRLSQAQGSGRTYAELAEETERNSRTVRYWVQVYRQHGRDKRPFNDCLLDVKGVTQQEETLRKAGTHARRVLRDPELRRDVWDDLDPSALSEVSGEVAKALLRRKIVTGPALATQGNGVSPKPRTGRFIDDRIYHLHRDAYDLRDWIGAGDAVFDQLATARAAELLDEAAEAAKAAARALRSEVRA